MDIILLKLGGSLITDKSKPYTARPDIIKQVLSEIKKVLTKHPDIQLIIGHGAGSFAHQSAKKYNTINGFNDEQGRLGASTVHTDAMKLNQIVTELAIEARLPVYTLQPSAFLLSVNKEHLKANFTILESLLTNKFIPLIYGDVIIDTKIGATIFSTDILFSILADHLNSDTYKVTKIIHAGNYDGVYDENNKVISEINSENFPQIKKNLGISEYTDVTGGMLQKVQESIKIAQKGIITHIINGSIKGALTKALNNDYSIGTRISK